MGSECLGKFVELKGNGREMRGFECWFSDWLCGLVVNALSENGKG